MLSYDSALERVLTASRPLAVETLPLAETVGRYLAAPLIAHLTQPPFNASAMDGYAVRTEEVTTGRSLVLAGVSKAGEGFEGPLGAGQAVRIFTGAPVPEGADAVIIQENAETDTDANTVRFVEVPKAGQNIRMAGNDFAAGDELATSGTVVTPRLLGLAAAAGNAHLPVHRRPRLALVATGSELVLPGDPIAPGQIVSSNSFALGALFAPATEKVTDVGLIPDNEAALTEALSQALESDADVIVTSGGASVGDHDLVQPVLQKLGVAIDFWKIMMRPGKPLMLGTYGDKLIFGLPGNPVSAFVTATVLVMPALAALAGANDPVARRLRLPLAGPLPANGPRLHFMRGRFAMTDTGTGVLPEPQTDSAHLSSVAQAELLIVHPENGAARAPGELVEVIPLVF